MTELKRGLNVDVDDEFARNLLLNPLKKQKLMEISQLSAIPTSEQSRGFNPFDKLMPDGPQLHNLPQDSIPIMNSPYEISQFFTDYKILNSLKYHETVQKIVNMFPPPLPPMIPIDSKSEVDPSHSIIIPFIYPPPPVIRPTPYIDDNEYFLKRMRKRDEQQREDDDDLQEIFPQKPVELAPLLFPPPNFMPYPLNANKSSITPHDLFTDLLDASILLPRVDMVMASAAGTLADLRAQASIEGFAVTQYENEAALKRRLEELHEDMESGIDYYENIDVSYKVDKKYKSRYDPFEGYYPPAVEIRSNFSNIKNAPFDPLPTNNIQTYTIPQLKEVPPYQLIIDSLEEYSHRDTLEEKARILQRSLKKLEQFDETYKLEYIRQRKRELLLKIIELKESKIDLRDDVNKLIKSEELIEIKDELNTERDLELVKLRFETDYEKLRQLTSYYNDTNIAYRKYNSNVSTKLSKLKNFFEYQKEFINDILSNERQLNEIVDLNNKESTRIYSHFVDRGYNKDLKRIVQLKLNKSKDHRDDKSFEQSLKSLIDDIKHNVFSEDLSVFNEVHDFMPLVSTKEFNLITTTIKSKADTKINMKHRIFRNPIYESNSDSSYNSGSTSANDLPKRRGRRANISNEIDEDSLSSEAYLLAKITKHFVGPQSVNPEELNEDYDMLGINSKWT